MKNLFALTAAIVVLFSNYSFSQDNSLPQTGKVGIGTLNPTVKLDVKGHVKIDSTLHVKDSILIEKNARVQQNLKVDGKLFLPNIEFSNGLNNVELLVRKPNGEVVKSDIGELQQIVYSKQCPTNPNEDILHPVWVNGLNKIFIDCPKINVGIGNSNPRVKLEVSGTIATASVKIGVANPENSLIRFHMMVPGSASTDNKVFLVENNARELFQISNNGIVRTREVMVNQEHPWPDYVFNNGYELLPLNKLESFIETNGHLPNVPSAENVEQNGQALGEMNSILLEKVEELTLYLIEQDKRIKMLETQVENCNK